MVYKVWVQDKLALETRSKRRATDEAANWRKFGFTAEVSFTREIKQ